MPFSHNRECILGNINCKLNVIVCYSGIHKVVMVRCKEKTP